MLGPKSHSDSEVYSYDIVLQVLAETLCVTTLVWKLELATSDLGAEIRDDGCLITINILDYISFEKACIAIIILVLLICFLGNLVLTNFSFWQFVLSESREMKQNFVQIEVKLHIIDGI